jgi:RNA polymerase sigma-70 factor, ECF subfamily
LQLVEIIPNIFSFETSNIMKSDKSNNKEKTKLHVTGEPIPAIHEQAQIKYLFEQYHSMIYKTAYRITGKPDDAEDILQTVFLRFIQTETQGNFPENPGGYLRNMAVNASLDLLRRRQRWKESNFEDTLQNMTSGKRSTGLEDNELRTILKHALLKVSELESKVFILKHFEELTNSEIAEMLNSSVNNINVALHSARNKLKKLLAKYMEIQL